MMCASIISSILIVKQENSECLQSFWRKSNVKMNTGDPNSVFF